ncbi:hypothetical protein Poly41_21780 [Novipirellula artificiosorum]|uniref:Uncharacterized protein n=1 Tax=Novipirellula artificiosorum TaxID=2528016 RepID=A0A5C6DT36_9BACT|nr:hypothetical protein Poly41_21780 [Novipirellula artificiosorum]
MDREIDDLVVVFVRTAVLECIEQYLEHIVDVTTATIGRVNQHIDRQRAGDGADLHVMKQTANVATKFSTAFADQRPWPHPPPVMIDTGRVGHFDEQHAQRFQGAVDACAGLEAGAGAVAE